MDDIEIKKILYQYSVKIFEMGLKSNPTDADNSEFTLPLIDLQLIPELLEQLRPLLMTPIQQKKIELADYILNQTFGYGEADEGEDWRFYWHTDNSTHRMIFTKYIRTIKQMEEGV